MLWKAGHEISLKLTAQILDLHSVLHAKWLSGSETSKDFLVCLLGLPFLTWNHSFCQLLCLVDGKEREIPGVYNATHSFM